MNGMLVVLSGPSGAGKGRIFKEILRRRNNIRKIPSVTTRELREDEVQGVDYISVPEEDFIEMQNDGCFFESVCYADNMYGTLRIPVEELNSKDIFLDKDVRGALSIKKKYPEAVTIYIMPKDVETLIKRRGNRGAIRQQIAKEEVALAKKLDFLVINDDIEQAVQSVENIIECMRMNSMKDKWNIKFLDEFY